MNEIPEVYTVESLNREAKADISKTAAQLAREEVWNVPSDADPAETLEIKPVTVTPWPIAAQVLDALLGAEEILEVLHQRGTRGVEQECSAGRIAEVYDTIRAAKRGITG